MTFDAQKLYWPPLSKLFETLIHISTDDRADVKVQEELRKYKEVLLKGTGFFKNPNPASLKALQTEAKLPVGQKKLPVDPGLREASFEASRLLELDEFQAYVLVRRWSQEGGEQVAADGLSLQQRASIQGYYFNERGYIHSCLDFLLQSDIGSPDPCTEFAKELLGAGLEDSICGQLEAAVATPAEPSGQQLARSLAVVSIDSEAAAARAEQAGAEKVALLDLATLLYAQQAESCSLERGTRLLTSLGPLLTAAPTQVPVSGRAPQRLDHLAFTLLVAVLDVGKLMRLLGEGGTLDAKSHRLGTPAARKEVDHHLAALQVPQGAGLTMQPPLLLAWATFCCLCDSLDGSSGGGVDWQSHAEAAWRGGALEALSGMFDNLALSPGSRIGHSYRRVLRDLASAMLGCFSLGPASLGERPLSHLLTFVCGIHESCEDLCQEFWEARGGSPLRHFLDQTRDIFPASAAPFLRLLCALAHGKPCAGAAAGYLDAIPRLTCEHSSREPGLQQEAGGGVLAAQPLPIRNTGLFVPQGTRGVVLPLSGGSRKAASEGSDVICDTLLVQWQAGLPSGLYYLLGCIASNVSQLREAAAHAGSGRPHAKSLASSVESLGLALRLLAQLSKEEPLAALQAAQLDVPGTPGASLPWLLARAIDVLSHLAEPPLYSIGSCLQILEAVAECMGGLVVEELATTALLQLAQARPTFGSRPEAGPELTETRLPNLEQFCSWHEAPKGVHPVTLSLLNLTVALISSGVSHPLLQGLVGFTMTQVLAFHQGWQYGQRSERWEVAAAALGVLRSALEHRPVVEQAPGFSHRVRVALNHRGAAGAFLLGAQPPSAPVLELLDAASGQAEVVPTEAAVLEWLHLVPLLFCAAPSTGGKPIRGSPFLAQELLEPMGGRGTALATALTSYVSYPGFSQEERALAVTCLAALGEACALVPTVCFAACLPQTPGEEADPEVRRRLVAPFLADNRASSSELFLASCQLLLTSIRHHPSMQDLLLYPTQLQPPPSSQDNDSTQARKRTGDDAGPGALLPAPAGKAADKSSGKSGSSGEASAIDGLWQVLQDAKELSGSQPAVLSAALQCLLALWQGGATTNGAVQRLRCQPGFWSALAACLPESLQRRLNLDQVGDGEAEPTAVTWPTRLNTAWQLSAESFALQILCLEAYRHPRPPAGTAHGDRGVWGLLEGWEEEDGGGRLLSLLQRYGTPPSATAPAERLQTAANLVALQIGAKLLYGGGLGDAVRQPGSLSGQLHAGFLPLIASFQRSSAAAEALDSLSVTIDARTELQSGSLEHHLRVLLDRQELGGKLLAAAETEGKVILHAEGYGPGYLYDANRLRRCLGRLFAARLPAVVALCAALSEESVAASVDDARLKALRSLYALVGVLAPAVGSTASASPPPPPLSILAAALRPLTDPSPSKRLPTAPASSHASQEGCLAVAAEIAQISLVLARWQTSRWQTSRGNIDNPQAVGKLALDSLRVATSWLAAVQSPGSGLQEAGAGKVDDLTACLLTLCLLTLKAAPHAAEVAGDAGEGGLQDALLQLFPVLAGISAAGGRHASASLALISTAVERHLQLGDWLPRLRDSLDIAALLQSAFSSLASPHDPSEGATEGKRQAGERASFATSALQLALTAAHHPAACQEMCTPTFFPILHAVAHWLLSPAGGGLGEDEGVEAEESRAVGPEACQAQWLALLSLYAVLVRSQAGRQRSDLACVSFAVLAHPRFLRILQPPPLSAWDAKEAESTLFFLCGMVRLQGRWQASLVQGLQLARHAAAVWVHFGAAPSLDREAKLDCPPTSAADKVLSSQPAELPLEEGWFRIVALGCIPSGNERVNGSAAPQLRSASHSPQPFSEYSARLAESIYGCCAQALAFLASSAPETSHEEAQAGDLGWPSREVLQGVQQQCVSLSYDISNQTFSAQKRVKRLCGTLLCILQASSELQEILGLGVDDGFRLDVQETKKRLQLRLGRF